VQGHLASEFARQAVQLAMPIALAYWFDWHSAQGPPDGPAKPVLHRQSVCASLAAGACECCAHAAQLTVLGASAYVFTGHIAKGPPSTP